jgi:hypothetical protein
LFLIKPEDLAWRPSNMMKIANADFLERTGSEVLALRFRVMPEPFETCNTQVGKFLTKP